MVKVNNTPLSAFAVYSQNNSIASQESNNTKRKTKNKKSKPLTPTNGTDGVRVKSANLKIAMKAKDKLNTTKQSNNSVLQKKNKSKTHKEVLENLSQTAQKENIYESVLNVIKNKKSAKNATPKQTVENLPETVVKQESLVKPKKTQKKEKSKKIDKIKMVENQQHSSSEEFSPKPKLQDKISKTNKTSKKKSADKIPKERSPVKIEKNTPEKTKTSPSKNDQNELNNSSQNIVKAIGSVSMDSVKTGEEIFQWLLNPVDSAKFFRENWEQQPIIIKRACSSYYSYLLSSNEIDHAFRKQKLFFTKNVDITAYNRETGVRETHNPPGLATAPLVWDYYANGCSIRILNPQTFFPKIHALNAALQEYFGCFVGANVYLTPAGTQGFAPHYDDIEAFVVQLEGAKLWKLYLPRSPAEVLPRYSSGNFTEADLGPPIQEVLLEAGDMLYFPRGIIHQGTALEDTHSLHITLSMYQKNSWADFLETLLPAALKCAIEEDVLFREGLPMHYLSHLGLVHSDKQTKNRSEFLSKLQELMAKMVTHAPVDAAADQLGKRFIHDSLPPFLRKWEMERTMFDDGETIKNGVVVNQAEMCLGTSIKLIRYNCVRVVSEEDSIRIYYSISNSKEYHAEEAQYLEIDEDLAPAIDALINSYPNFISVEELPIDDDIAKIQIASDLWDHGIIMTENPLGYSSDNE